jgi:hypothetical protein
MAWLEKLSRITAVPLILRGVAFLSAFAGLWLAAPQAASAPKTLGILAFLAVLPALAIGTRLVDVVMAGTVILWVITTLGFGEPAEPLRVFGVAAALYLLHSSAAMAAALPYDAVVDPQVPLRWAARSALVVAAAGVVAAVVVLLAPLMTPTTSVIALFAGLGVVLATVALLTMRRL